MSKNDIHQLIENKNPERKEALRKKVKERLELSEDAEQEHSKPALSIYKKRYRIFASVSTALAVACLAIVLPIVLKRDTGVGPTERYCHAADCVETVTDYTLKDYSEQNNLSLLYIDWYDVADAIQTKKFVNINDSSDIIYFEETLANGETGSIVTLYITDLYTKVDIFEDVENSCENVEYISAITVNWGYRNIKGFAYFEYLGRGYAIELQYPMAEDSVLELVESMIQKI